MKNPYIVLDIPQDANKSEIMKAQVAAMKQKKYSLQEIAISAKQLLDPAKRLAADFMFPAKVKARRVQKINTELKYIKVDLDSLDDNALNSL